MLAITGQLTPWRPEQEIGRSLLDGTGGLTLRSWLWLPEAPILHSQHVVPEAALPLSLVEEVVEVAAEGDEDKAKGQEAKNACGGPGVGKVLPIPGVGAAVVT